jgi:cyclophilin family peptidyl-prolyl cis-trans isomerase/HEAT repeat protein
MRRSLLLLSWLSLTAACASVPPPVPQVVVPYETKLASILRLEDHRVLTDARAVPEAPPPALDSRGRPLPVAPPPPPTDLATLLRDAEARVRRRAALAVGRVGLPDGVVPLTTTLADPDPEVRAMAAFALGLIGGTTVVEPLTGALADESPHVRGRAAQALGLAGRDVASAAAPAVGAMVATLVEAGALSSAPADDAALTPEQDAVLRGLGALTSLGSYDGIATAVLDAQGRPRSSWWPVAFALSRVGDDRAVPALRALLSAPSPTAVAYAVRGLGERKAVAAAGDLLPLLRPGAAVHPQVRVNAVRAVAQLGDAGAVAPLLTLLNQAGDDGGLTLEVVSALGTLGSRDAEEALIDRITARWAPLRAAVIKALARIDAETFTTILSGLDPDGDWRVRAALAEAMGDVPAEVARPTLERLRSDADLRVVPAVLRAMGKAQMDGLDAELTRRLASDDAGVRAAAASVAGEYKRAAVRPALVEMLTRARGDRAGASLRWSLLSALAQIDAAAAEPHYREALADPDWSVRLRAARWLDARSPAGNAAMAIRPAPTGHTADFYEAERFVAPKVSPQAFIDTPRGTIEIQLSVLDAPLTVDNFVTLARQGYYSGLQLHRVVPNFVIQDGDPRGDGMGGPGYSIRDELHEQTYARGTLGMALAGPDTGGSQWFITHSPQPHLDGRYTIFGRVTAGMEVVDALQVGDTVTRIRIWDGVEMR